jgi:hypothetical protein
MRWLRRERPTRVTRALSGHWCKSSGRHRFADAAYRISLGEHPYYKIPALGFRGIPVGVDARKVVETKTLPVIDIMMVHRKPGFGLAGMGLVRPPMRCFEDAVKVVDE